jgi:hypothetical protein
MGMARPGARAAQIGFMQGGAAPLQAETTALVAQMTVTPSAGRQAVINEAIYALKNAGLWTLCDFLFVFAAHDGQAGLVNWINPGQVASTVATVTFTIDRGYNGDGVSGYIGAGFNWSALTRFTQNNAHIGAWIQSGGTATQPIIGSPTTQRVTLLPRSAGLMSSRLNSTVSGTSATVAQASGHSLTTRSAATNYDQHKNGAAIGNIIDTSTTVVAEQVVFLRGPTTFNTAQVLAAAHGGAALTPTQIANFYSALLAYMTAVGAA